MQSLLLSLFFNAIHRTLKIRNAARQPKAVFLLLLLLLFCFVFWLLFCFLLGFFFLGGGGGLVLFCFLTDLLGILLVFEQPAKTLHKIQQ